MKNARTIAMSVLVASSRIAVLYAQDGTLDNTFDLDGLLTTDVGFHTYDEANAVVLQPDEKIVVGGTSGYEDAQDLAVVRYLHDGTLDDTFGTGGKATLSISPGNDVVSSLVLQPDGKILAGGYTYGPNGITFALARFNPDGAPDTDFGTNGVVISDHQPGLTATGRALAMQNDGKILLAGGGAGGFALVRYNADGTEDQQFGDLGLALCSFGSSGAQANGIAVQGDGLIVVAGYSSGSADSIAVARFTSNGQLDPGFGTGGKTRASYFVWSTVGNAMSLCPDGRIVVAGSGNGLAMVARFNTDGSLDNNFDSDGITVLDIPGATTSTAYAVAVLADERIVLAGSITNASNDFLLARLNGDGSPDASFNGGGSLSTDFNGVLDVAKAIAVQPDGAIVLAGRTNGGAEDYNFAVARYLSSLSTGIVPDLGNIDHVVVEPDPIVANSTLSYTLVGDDVLSIDLYDARGALVRHLLDHQLRSAGSHSEPLRIGTPLPAGGYSLVLRGRSSTSTAQVVAR